MKKLMIATMTAGLAVGAFAAYAPIEVLKTTALDFEDGTAESPYDFGTDAVNWVNIAEKNTVKAYETPAGGNKNYLHLDTDGEDVYRAFDDATDWGAENPTYKYATMGTNLWIDTKVKFTASEEAPALDAGAKFALWLKEIEGESESTYELHALCGLLDGDGNTIQTNVVLDTTVLGEPLSPANWYRLVIRPDWDNGGGAGFFTVTLDGTPLATATALVDPLIKADFHNQDLIAAGKFLPSRVSITAGDDAKRIVAVGFNGTGDIDDFKIADADPFYVYVNSVTLNVTETNVVVGQTFKLTATVDPVDATVQTVTWKSDNPTVADVDTETGLVTCKAAGDATITANCDGATATCAVNVTAAASIDVVVPTSDKWTAIVEPTSGKAGDTITVTYTANGGYYFGNNESTMTATGTLQANGSIAFESEPETDTKPFKGQGTEADPFQIWTVTDLKKLDELVDGGEAFAGKYFKQMADIDFVGVTDWSGIGTVGGEGKTFSGVYDGDNKKITGITTTSTVNYSGILFNNVDNAEIKNLTVDVYADASGGFSAFGGANATVFSNVVVKGTILGTHHCGGFTCFGQWTDQMSTYIDCTNEATVASSKSAGGFCGKPQTGATFIRCVNKGTIGAEGKMGSDGGLGGFCSGGSYGHFTDCTNEGVVLGSFGQFGSSAPTSIAGTMTARDDQFAATAVFDGLNFATVADNVATLISNDQVVVGGAYKVMSPIATIPVTLDVVGQTIAFDDALNTAFDATITADGVAVTTNIEGTVTTYTAIEAPTPGEDWPVDPTVTEGSDATATFPNLPAAFKGADAGLVAAWAKGKGGVAYADMATASIDAFLLDCAANEVETEAAKFKIISIDNVGGEWIVKVTGEKTEGENYTVNAKVEIFDVTSTIDSETAVATGAKGFFKAKLVPFIVTK